ncbi:hypothetical protein BH10ACI2_BH10ACI2_15610 [soil metagenome]
MVGSGCFEFMRSLSVFIAVLLVAAFTQIAGAQTKYDIYSNARFNYEIEYPVGVLTPQEEAPNGDGRIFISKDKTAEMRVWGQYNALFDTIKKAYLSDLKERPTGVSYKALLKGSYVISGSRDGKIFYQKTMLHGKDGDSGAVFCTFTIEYKTADKAKFDPIVKRISRSFKFN